MLKTLLLSLAMSAALLASAMLVYTTRTSPRPIVVAMTPADSGR